MKVSIELDFGQQYEVLLAQDFADELFCNPWLQRYHRNAKFKWELTNNMKSNLRLAATVFVLQAKSGKVALLL